MAECIAAIILKTGDSSRYKFQNSDDNYFIKNKYIKGVNIYNEHECIIDTSSIAHIEFIKR